MSTEWIDMEIQFEREDSIEEYNILVSNTGPNRFRMEELHICVCEIRFGDIFEAHPCGDGEWKFIGVIRRGRFKHLEGGVPRGWESNPDFLKILDFAVERGGQWEVAFGGILTIAVPWKAVRALRAQLDGFWKNAGPEQLTEEAAQAAEDRALRANAQRARLGD